MPFCHEIFECNPDIQPETKFIVEYYIEAGEDEVLIDRNGNPGTPSSSSECVIVSIKYDFNGEEVEDLMLPFIQNDIEKECWKLHNYLMQP